MKLCVASLEPVREFCVGWTQRYARTSSVLRSVSRLSNGRKPRPVRCLVILGLCLFVTAGLQAQTRRPWMHHNQGYGLRLALFRGFKTGVSCATHPNESTLTTG